MENFQLKISRLEDGSWMNNVELVDLPESVLDLSRIGPIVRRKRIQSSQNMDTEADTGADQGEGEQVQG